MSASHLHFRNEPTMTVIIIIIFGISKEKKNTSRPKTIQNPRFLTNRHLTCEFDNILHNLKYNIVFFLFY